MLQMLLLCRHADLMVLTRAVNRLAVTTHHRAADHGHCPAGLRYFAVDADYCSVGYCAQVTDIQRSRYAAEEIPESRFSKGSQRARSAHIKNYASCSTVHDAVDIGVSLIDEEFEIYGSFGRGIDYLDVVH